MLYIKRNVGIKDHPRTSVDLVLAYQDAAKHGVVLIMAHNAYPRYRDRFTDQMPSPEQENFYLPLAFEDFEKLAEDSFAMGSKPLDVRPYQNPLPGPSPMPPMPVAFS